MSYYMPWDDEHNMHIAKAYGFRDLQNEWDRQGCIESYAQIDSVGYMVHLWLKYPKFGFARTSDIASRWVRKGMITRDKAMELVGENDYKLDQRALIDFCECLGYSEREFWAITERFWNKDIFAKSNGRWRFRDGTI
jgi:hypothetical protein